MVIQSTNHMGYQRLLKTAEDFLETSGVNPSNSGGFQEIRQFQEYISDNKITVFDGLNTDTAMFSGNSLSAKKLRLQYDRDYEHYNVTPNLKGAMAKKYIYNGCDTSWYNTHKCDKVCTLCTPPRTKDQKSI